MNASVYQSKTPKFDFSLVDEEEFKKKVRVHQLDAKGTGLSRQDGVPEKWEMGRNFYLQSDRNSFFQIIQKEEVRV